MPDPIFDEPRLAAIYDPLDPDRSDLDAYVSMVDEFGARRVIDVGCGTGTFACLLARRGVDVVGVDPSAGSLDVARTKQGAERVSWVHGEVSDLPLTPPADLATMTANVAQVFVDDAHWTSTLRSVRQRIRPDGRLVFEARDPAKRAWLEWNRAESESESEIASVGRVRRWVDLLDVRGDVVSFRWTFVFASDGAVLTSDTTLRFRGREEIADSLQSSGFAVEDVRDAPDRPGRELVFVARHRA